MRVVENYFGQNLSERGLYQNLILPRAQQSQPRVEVKAAAPIQDQIQISEAAIQKYASPPLAAMAKLAEAASPDAPLTKMRAQILNYLLSQGVPRQRAYAQVENIMARLGYSE